MFLNTALRSNVQALCSPVKINFGAGHRAITFLQSVQFNTPFNTRSSEMKVTAAWVWNGLLLDVIVSSLMPVFKFG